MTDSRISFLKNTETGAITDAMNLIGVAGWMENIYPANPEMKISGKAFTVQFSVVRDPGQETYNMFEVFDLCEPGDVVVISAPNKGAVVGENMMHALTNKGLAGMILDGRTRDWGVIMNAGIPHFSCGPAIMLPANFRITAVQVPVLCGGVVVEPGDYITGDIDGVIAIPKSRIDDVIYQAEMVAEVESELEQALNQKLEMCEIVSVSKKKKSPRTAEADK
ncbi:MAG: RraA family protein [Oscillospiraceae bacterium]